MKTNWADVIAIPIGVLLFSFCVFMLLMAIPGLGIVTIMFIAMTFDMIVMLFKEPITRYVFFAILFAVVAVQCRIYYEGRKLK